MAEPVLDTPYSDYRIDLEIFSGPMDLLLYLIKKEEVNIYEIPIAKITDQYLRYVEMMENLNLEVAGEFILMAATLIRIKTRLLLPRDEEDPDEPDPREELIMALVEYRKYKEAGEMLRDHAIQEEKVYVPQTPVREVEGKVEYEPATSLYDLIIAFRDVLAAQREESYHEVAHEEISVEDRMDIILSMVDTKDGVTFVELFADARRKIIAVVTFIALLELARMRRISLMQAVPFAELRVYRGEHYQRPTEEVIPVDQELSYVQTGDYTNES